MQIQVVKYPRCLNQSNTVGSSRRYYQGLDTYLSNMLPVENPGGRERLRIHRWDPQLLPPAILFLCKCKCKKRSGVGTSDPEKRTIRSIHHKQVGGYLGKLHLKSQKHYSRWKEITGPHGDWASNQIPIVCNTDVKNKGSVLVLTFPFYANLSLLYSFSEL